MPSIRFVNRIQICRTVTELGVSVDIRWSRRKRKRGGSGGLHRCVPDLISRLVALPDCFLLCKDPFVGIDLATVPFEVYESLRMIHEEAEDIEIEEFDPAIEASGEDTPEGKPCIVSRRKFWRIIDEDWVFFLGKALSVGKTKNRVLYATVSPPPLLYRRLIFSLQFGASPLRPVYRL